MGWGEAIADVAMAASVGILYFTDTMGFEPAVVLYCGGVLSALFMIDRRLKAIHDAQ